MLGKSIQPFVVSQGSILMEPFYHTRSLDRKKKNRGRTDHPKRSSLEAEFLSILTCDGHVVKALGLDLGSHK